MNKVERKAELEREFEETRFFDKDVMEKEAEITVRRGKEETKQFKVDLDKQWKREIWESQKKCGSENAVRIDVFSHGGKPECVTVFEIKEGKLFKSEFNSLLEPVAGGTSPASLVEEHRRKLEEFMKGEFFKHAMGMNEEYAVRVQETVAASFQGNYHSRSIYLPTKIASEMQLEYKMSCKWEEGRDSGGDYLVMIPLKTSAVQVRLQKGTNSFSLVIPQNMPFIAGLKLGDYVEWSREGNLLSLRKTEGTGVNTRKITKMSGTSSSIAVTIPKAMAEELKLEAGMYGLWTFDKDENGKPRFWLELSKDNPHIVAISRSSREYADEFRALIPQGMGEWLKARDEAILQPKDDRLYIRKKQ